MLSKMLTKLKSLIKNSAYWLAFFLYYVLLVLAIGSLAGAILFAFFGLIFFEINIITLLKKGLWIGFRYAGVWAGGLAIVLCFLKAGRKEKTKKNIHKDIIHENSHT